jgi:hypothetical protein
MERDRETDMGNERWLERVQEQLARQSLPSAYIRRFMEELSDHFRDFMEENMGTTIDVSTRLGDPEQVAAAAALAYRRRSFLSRHPTAAFAVFGITPVVPLFVLGYVACFLLAVVFQLGFMGFVGLDGDRLGPVSAVVWSILLSLTVAACSALATRLYGEIAARLQIGRAWIMVSCAVLALAAARWEFTIHDSGFCGVSAGVRFFGAALPAQLLVPFAVAWLYTRRADHASYPATSFFVFAVSPLLSLIVLWGALYVAVCLSQEFLGLSNMFTDERYSTAALVWWARGFTLLMSVVPAVAASLLYCNLAQWLGVGRKWVYLSSAMIATIAAMYCFRVAPYTNESGSHLGLSDGLGLYSLTQLGQFIVPLAIAWSFLRYKQEQNRLPLAA